MYLHVMAAKDIYHEKVRLALEKDGWMITHDPYTIEFGGTGYQIDLGAEKMLAAQKDGQKIAIEVKSFISPSPITSFHHALGQYLNYLFALRQQEAERVLYLAVPLFAYEETFAKPIVQLTLQEIDMKLVVFDVASETIHLWKN
jgi:hypothetical protein